jgi:hypothetical protein
MRFSGILTTILGKTATNTKGAGRERRVHHSKSLPLLLTGERLFFGVGFLIVRIYKILLIQLFITKCKRLNPDIAVLGGFTGFTRSGLRTR